MNRILTIASVFAMFAGPALAGEAPVSSDAVSAAAPVEAAGPPLPVDSVDAGDVGPVRYEQQEIDIDRRFSQYGSDDAQPGRSSSADN